MKTKISALITVALLLPLTSFAQATLSGFDAFLGTVSTTLGKIVPIIFAVAAIGFFYGLVKYIFGAEHDKDAAKKTMLWGVIALFLMVSVWGLVGFLADSTGIDSDAAPNVDNLIP